MRRQRGFTLLEVLVALAILALSTAAVLRQSQLGIKQQYELELKSYALWIADDALTAVLARSEWPPLGRLEQTQAFQGQEWVVTTDVQTTDDPLLRKVEVSIAIAGGAENAPALLSMTTYRGQY